jgi:tRNA(Ile)-lysidine synthase
MLEQFLNHIEKNALAQKHHKLLLAVSGGVDSMVMMHLFKECGFEFSVAHCNFQLRSNESDEDETLVRDVCSQLSVQMFARRFNTSQYTEDTGLSIQMAARDLRYQWFEELLEKENFDSVATAHHLDDSLETIIMNLVKGTGYEGLSGIKVKTGKVIRPILFASRSQILVYAQANNIGWREDSSNSSDTYQRNFIRNNIVPLLRELNPGLDKTFSETHDRLSQSWKLFHARLELIFSELIEFRNDQTLIDKTKLARNESSALVLWEMTKGFGFNYSQCKDIVNPGHGVGRTFLSATHQITIDRTNLIISKRVLTRDFSLSISGDEKEVGSAIGSIRVIAGERPNKIDPSGNVAELDLQMVKYPLIWRNWKHGDSFVPLGMKHSKKLSDFLSTKKYRYQIRIV